MSKKTFNLITGISGGVATITSAVIAYLQPEYTPAIIGAVGIVETTVVEICSLFLNKE